MKNEEISIRSFPLEYFSVKLEEKFRQDLLEKINQKRQNLEFKEKINSISKQYGKNWNLKRQRTIVYTYKNSEFIPAWFIFSVGGLFYSPKTIEDKVIEYCIFRGKSKISKKLI